jgi:hypothetical protein
MDAFFGGSLYLLQYLAVDTYIVVLLVVRQFCRKEWSKVHLYVEPDWEF